MPSNPPSPQPPPTLDTLDATGAPGFELAPGCYVTSFSVLSKQRVGLPGYGGREFAQGFTVTVTPDSPVSLDDAVRRAWDLANAYVEQFVAAQLQVELFNLLDVAATLPPPAQNAIVTYVEKVRQRAQAVAEAKTRGEATHA